MPGNSQRRGAMRKPGTKKGPVVGSGGQRRQGLEGRGPTPRAEDRPGHTAQRRARSAEKHAGGGQGAPRSGPGGPGRGTGGPGRGSGSGGGRGGGGGRPGAGSGGRAPRSATTEAVAGRNAVLEALEAGVPASALHVQQNLDADDRVRDAMKMAVARRVPLLETTRGDLDRLSGGVVHQGIVLQVPAYEYAHAEDLLADAMDHPQPLLVVLDGVTDPRNLGAVVRSAAAFGAQGVVIPERRAAGMTASAWKTSAGAAARVPVARATNLVRFLVAAKRSGATVLGLAMGGAVTLPALDARVATGPVVLVVGSEGKGLGRLVSQTCDELVAIPMHAGTESLNAGVAAGIALYAVAAARR